LIQELELFSQKHNYNKAFIYSNTRSQPRRWHFLHKDITVKAKAYSEGWEQAVTSYWQTHPPITMQK
jgi:hypothetical protein